MSRRRALVTACLAAALLTPLVQAGGAQAAPLPAIVGLIAYQAGSGGLTTSNPDGSGEHRLGLDTFGRASWSPDGSRLVYSQFTGTGVALKTRGADGSEEVTLTDEREDPTDPVWTPDGSTIIYSNHGRLLYLRADSSTGGELFNSDPALWDSLPAVAPDGTVVFNRSVGQNGQPSLYRFVPGSGEPPSLFIQDARDAAFSMDGTRIAYMLDPHTNLGRRIWVADADGSNPVQVSQEEGWRPAWSPDGADLLYIKLISEATPLKKVHLATGEVTEVTGFAEWASWQPVRRGTVARVWGQDHVETAIAASQFTYATKDARDPRTQAGAVVLSRDDTFLDALVGSAFAVRQQAPLLITNRTALDARVEREIARVLGTSGTVYLLGGELALTPAVADRLASLGYSVQRIWGQTHYDTALELDRRITATPTTAIVATGANFYDALAAGAAAGARPDAVIVLTNGDAMPAQSAAYLNGLHWETTRMWTVGGPGDRAFRSAVAAGAIPNWRNVAISDLVGVNEKDTAVAIAKFFFHAPATVALATNRTWFDALTGGAMIGSRGGPLLITDPTGLYPGVRDLLSRNSGSISTAVLLGGPAALPDALRTPVGDAVGLPGQWDFVSRTPQ